MELVGSQSTLCFQIPALLGNGTKQVLDPTFQTFLDLEQRALEIYLVKKRLKRETEQDQFQGRRYIIYDRPPEKKEKKKKRK